MSPMLTIAIRAARAAGDFLTRSARRLGDIKVETKGPNDYVSAVDREAEARIVRTLLDAYPHHAVLAEEGGRTGSGDHVWIVDPLDGTTNYLHGFPVYCVSIGLRVRGRLELAVVYDPERDELFTAERGRGAQLNQQRIRVSSRDRLNGALLGTGFPFRQSAYLDAYLDSFRKLFAETAGVRRAGSAALDLAYVACGRLDGFWEMGLKPWDIAAGLLLVREAGGIVTDFSGGESSLETGHVIAGAPRVHTAMLRSVGPVLRNAVER